MKKFILLFVVLFVSFGFAATEYESADVANADLSNMSVGSKDLVSYVLFDNEADTSDTIAQDVFLVKGPYPLGYASGVNFKSMNLVGTNLGAADSFAVFYQVGMSNSIADTSSRWHALGDTLAPDGCQNTTLDLSALTGKYLWLMFQNQTGSVSIVPDWQWAVFRKNKDYIKK